MEPSDAPFFETLPIINELGGVFLESSSMRVEKISDPFDSYIHSVKLRILGKPSLFLNRFVHGYQVLRASEERIEENGPSE